MSEPFNPEAAKPSPGLRRVALAVVAGLFVCTLISVLVLLSRSTSNPDRSDVALTHGYIDLLVKHSRLELFIQAAILNFSASSTLSTATFINLLANVESAAQALRNLVPSVHADDQYLQLFSTAIQLDNSDSLLSSRINLLQALASSLTNASSTISDISTLWSSQGGNADVSTLMTAMSELTDSDQTRLSDQISSSNSQRTNVLVAFIVCMALLGAGCMLLAYVERLGVQQLERFKIWMNTQLLEQRQLADRRKLCVHSLSSPPFSHFLSLIVPSSLM